MRIRPLIILASLAAASAAGVAFAGGESGPGQDYQRAGPPPGQGCHTWRWVDPRADGQEGPAHYVWRPMQCPESGQAAMHRPGEIDAFAGQWPHDRLPGDCHVWTWVAPPPEAARAPHYEWRRGDCGQAMLAPEHLMPEHPGHAGPLEYDHREGLEHHEALQGHDGFGPDHGRMHGPDGMHAEGMAHMDGYEALHGGERHDADADFDHHHMMDHHDGDGRHADGDRDDTVVVDDGDLRLPAVHRRIATRPLARAHRHAGCGCAAHAAASVHHTVHRGEAYGHDDGRVDFERREAFEDRDGAAEADGFAFHHRGEHGATGHDDGRVDFEHREHGEHHMDGEAAEGFAHHHDGDHDAAGHDGGAVDFEHREAFEHHGGGDAADAYAFHHGGGDDDGAPAGYVHAYHHGDEQGSVDGYYRQQQQSWSHSEAHAWSSGWQSEGDDYDAPASATDAYGYLTWPGKTHFQGPRPQDDDGR
jgi:hypothetical protein